MDDAERGVAVLHLVDQNAHRPDVVERFDPPLLAAHLVPDAVDVLGAPAHLGFHAGGGQLALERRLNVLDVMLAVEAPLIEQARDALIGFGLECAQGKILELPLELPYAQAIGQRREEIERLARGLGAGVGRRIVTADQEAQCLRALGELDQDDADVLDHRQQHLAQILRLQVVILPGGAAGRGANRAHARRADDDLCDLGADGFRERRRVEAGRERCAEQDGGAHRVGVELERGDDACRAERAIEPRLAIGRAQPCIANARRVQRLADRGALGRCVRGGDMVDPRGERFRVRGRQRARRRGVNDCNHASDYTGAAE